MLTYRLSGLEILTNPLLWVLSLARLSMGLSMIHPSCGPNLLPRDIPYVGVRLLKVRITRGRSVGKHALTTPRDSSTMVHMAAGVSDQGESVSEILGV